MYPCLIYVIDVSVDYAICHLSSIRHIFLWWCLIAWLLEMTLYFVLILLPEFKNDCCYENVTKINWKRKPQTCKNDFMIFNSVLL